MQHPPLVYWWHTRYILLEIKGGGGSFLTSILHFFPCKFLVKLIKQTACKVYTHCELYTYCELVEQNMFEVWVLGLYMYSWPRNHQITFFLKWHCPLYLHYCHLIFITFEITVNFIQMWPSMMQWSSDIHDLEFAVTFRQL